MFNFRLDEDTINAVRTLRAEGYQVSAVLRKALIDKARAVRGGR
jgi:hypothetical protein